MASLYIKTGGALEPISGGSGDHSELSNLGYDESGHTGFASSTALTNETNRATQAETSLRNDLSREVPGRLAADEGFNSRITNNEGKIANIQAVIPNQATADNQLADKAFVNSSLSASAARALSYDVDGAPFPAKPINDEIGGVEVTYYYKKTPTDPTDNDYIVVTPDADYGNGQVRYGREGTEWIYRYKINDAPFTAVQMDAINSGATTEKIASIADKLEKIESSTAGDFVAVDTLNL